jgi:hypothetical protein
MKLILPCVAFVASSLLSPALGKHVDAAPAPTMPCYEESQKFARRKKC